MLSETEKVNARRLMGYPVHGSSSAGNMGFLAYQSYGLVEYRLSNLSSDEESALRQLLTDTLALEQALPGASSTLDTQAAGEWTRNPAELAERIRLLQSWCRRLCSFLGVPPGPGLAGGSNSVTLIT